MFVIRVGDWGGYMPLDCDDPLAVPRRIDAQVKFAQVAFKRVRQVRFGQSLTNCSTCRTSGMGL
jgi:hypothetical protein